ncbi:MAG: DUF4744 domain-containing protein [Tannerella sp.]|nr:DUF4744 domain-containing protein [Tannerella sp.]
MRRHIPFSEFAIHTATTRIRSLQTRVPDLRTGVYNLQTHVCNLQTRVYKPKTSVYNLQTRVYNLQTRVYNLQTRVYNLQTHVYKPKTSVYNLQTRVYKLKTRVYSLQTRVYTSTSKFVRNFVNQRLRYNQTVTNEDRVKLGLNVPDTTPTPVATPTTWPIASTRSAGPRQIRVDWHDSLSASKAKPTGVHGCEIRHSILDTPPTTNDDLLRSDFATRTPHTFNFNEQQRGKSIYFCLRWETNKGDKGPWSEILKAIIP